MVLSSTLTHSFSNYFIAETSRSITVYPIIYNHYWTGVPFGAGTAGWRIRPNSTSVQTFSYKPTDLL